MRREDEEPKERKTVARNLKVTATCAALWDAIAGRRGLSQAAVVETVIRDAARQELSEAEYQRAIDNARARNREE